MKRREFIAASAGIALGWAFAAQAQRESQSQSPKIGYLSLAPGPSPRSEALRQGLRDLGYVENQTILIEYRWSGGDLNRLREAAEELVRMKADVIVTGGPAATLVAARATATVPIVMAVDYDPVGAGFVKSLARPGGNITGLSILNLELAGKRLELLKETAPGVTLVAVLWNPSEPNAATYLSETQASAPAVGVRVQSFEVRAPGDLEAALAAAKQAGADGLAVLTDPVTLFHRTEVGRLAAEHRLPAVYSERLFVEAGGLMSYGASDRDLHRRAAIYVDKILKGTKPADLPVEQPTQFELVLNMRAAKTLGLRIPPAILDRADEVIE
jgi:putative ABC transport system substrate-binding protein